MRRGNKELEETHSCFAVVLIGFHLPPLQSPSDDTKTMALPSSLLLLLILFSVEQVHVPYTRNQGEGQWGPKSDDSKKAWYSSI
jgi:hypothetical protein